MAQRAPFCSRFLTLLLLLLSCGALQSRNSPKIFYCDDSDIHYSVNKTDLNHGDCTNGGEQCHNLWWQETFQSRKLGNGSQDVTSRATNGPKSLLTFTFTNSTSFTLSGKFDQPKWWATFNDSHKYEANASNSEGKLVFRDDLVPTKTYTLQLHASGGLFQVVAITLDSSGRPVPTQSYSSSSTSTSESIPAQSSTSQAPDPSLSSTPQGASDLTGTTSEAAPTSPPSDDGSNASNTAQDTIPSGLTQSVPPSRTKDDVGASENTSIQSSPGKQSDVPFSHSVPSGGGNGGNNGNGGHKNGAIVAGTVVGTLIFLIVLLIAAWYVRRWIRVRRAPSYAFRNGTAGFEIVVNYSPTEVHRESSVPDTWEPFSDTLPKDKA